MNRLREAAIDAGLGPESTFDDLRAWTADQRRADVIDAATLYLIQELRRASRAHVRAIETTESAPVASTARSLLADEAAEATRDTARRLASLRHQIDSAIQNHAADLLVTWTPALLGSPVRMPDGRRTTWGTATVADHQERIEMLASQAAASIDASSRHARAIADLHAAGAHTLNELVTQAAAA